MASGDDAVWVGHDPAVIQEHVHVIAGREQRTDVASQHEIWLLRPLDGFRDFRVGRVDQIADLVAEVLLPVR